MSSYKNPFAEFNTNIMSSEQISELFAEPFELFRIKDTDITNEKSSIIFVGGRGTGKTMLLRQFSYNVQRVMLSDRTTFLEKVRQDRFLGIYFRVDNPLLRSLDSFAESADDSSFAESVFTHYFELTVFKDYLEIVRIFLSENSIRKGSKQYISILSELAKLLDSPEAATYSDIDELLEFVVKQINYIWKYQSEKAIDIEGNIKFSPTCGVFVQGRLTNEFLRTSIMSTLNLTDINILLLIDEFENFSATQQRVLNTAMRFTKEYGARFRIGMRPDGFKTYGTLNDSDFLKEGRDYRKVEIGFTYVKKDNSTQYGDLVREIADKRLASVQHFSDRSIVDFLGDSEDLETEAKEIVKGRTKHFDVYIRLINEQNGTEYDLSNLQHLRHENPLFEMENLRLLLGGKSLEYVTKAFNEHLISKISEESKKYSNDYDKKYKLTFVFLLCSIYQVEKKGYYSFTDYCQMSSGIIGYFIELCRKAFDIAYFRERDLLFSGQISKKTQTDAAYEYAQSERESISRIAEYGGKLKVFIDNIGNAFSHIHRDLYMRYPETNLFPVDEDSLSEENKQLIKIASIWSLVVKKPNTQDVTAKGRKQDIYYLNRSLAPIFKISYRTRGGLNPIAVNDSFFEVSFKPQSILVAKKSRGRKETGESQMTLFSNVSEDPPTYRIAESDTEE